MVKKTEKSKSGSSKKDNKSKPISGKNSSVAQELAALEAEWGQAEEKSGGGEVPDGKYAVQIEEVVIGNSKASGRLQVNWTLSIVNGEFKNRKFWKHDGIDSAEGLSWLRTGLARLGVEWPSSPDALPDALDGLVGTFAQVTAKTKAGNDIQNVYFDKALDSDAAAGEEDVVEEEGDEETSEEETTEDLKKGDRVICELEGGEEYAGKILSIDEDEETVMVKFDDGDKLEVPLGDVRLETSDADGEGENEEEEEESSDDEESESEDESEEDESEDEDTEEEEESSDDEDEEEEEADEEEADEPTVTVSPKAKFLPADEKALGVVAKKNKFDPSEYEKPQDLALELAEYLGVSGEFKTWADLVKKLQVAKKK